MFIPKKELEEASIEALEIFLKETGSEIILENGKIAGIIRT